MVLKTTAITSPTAVDFEPWEWGGSSHFSPSPSSQALQVLSHLQLKIEINPGSPPIAS